MSTRKTVESRFGPLVMDYLSRTEETIQKAIQKHPRLLAIRVDLRFPDDEESLSKARTDSSVITRFMKSLNERVKADLKRKAKAGKRVHPCTLRYVWVREFGDKKGNKHYHVLLLLNKDTYYHPGDYFLDQGNLASMISGAWASAIGVAYPRYKYLTYFPTHGCYYLDKNNEKTIKTYDDLMFRTSYMAKLATKCSSDGERNFGCSQN